LQYTTRERGKKKKKEAFILKSTISGKTSSQARVAELHKLSRIYKQNPSATNSVLVPNTFLKDFKLVKHNLQEKIKSREK
jgi:hypothetical protein